MRKAVAELEIDLGKGPEKVFFANVSLLARKTIISEKMTIIGKDKDGNDLYGVPPSKMLDVVAESLAASIIDADGKTRFKKQEILEMDGESADKMHDFFTDNVGLQGPEKAREAKELRDKTAEEKAAAEENPSLPKTSS